MPPSVGCAFHPVCGTFFLARVVKEKETAGSIAVQACCFEQSSVPSQSGILAFINPHISGG